MNAATPRPSPFSTTTRAPSETRRSGRRRPSPTLALPVALAAVLIGGCATHDRAGEVELLALGPTPLSFDSAFAHGCYAVREAENSFWFSNVPLESLMAATTESPLQDGVFLHAQLMWIPKAGNTPMQSSATNLVTRVLVVSNGEAGLYGGAAFARVDGDPGDETVSLEIEGGTLTLLERTAGFVDLLSPAGLSGEVTARLGEADATRWRRAVSQYAANAFGKPMWVDAQPAAGKPTAAFAWVP